MAKWSAPCEKRPLWPLPFSLFLLPRITQRQRKARKPTRSQRSVYRVSPKQHEANMSKLQVIKEAEAASTGQKPRSKSASSASNASSATSSPRTRRKYKETLNFVTFHSKVNMRRKWRSKTSTFAKFIDLESDFDSSELNAYTVRNKFWPFFTIHT